MIQLYPLGIQKPALVQPPSPAKSEGVASASYAQQVSFAILDRVEFSSEAIIASGSVNAGVQAGRAGPVPVQSAPITPSIVLQSVGEVLSAQTVNSQNPSLSVNPTSTSGETDTEDSSEAPNFSGQIRALPGFYNVILNPNLLSSAGSNIDLVA